MPQGLVWPYCCLSSMITIWMRMYGIISKFTDDTLILVYCQGLSSKIVQGSNPDRMGQIRKFNMNAVVSKKVKKGKPNET